jgi:hypothetical protein
MRPSPHSTLILLAILALCALGTFPVDACPVCYGEQNDAPIFQGAEAAILFLLGFTYTLISGGAVGFLLLRRRQRRALGA